MATNVPTGASLQFASKTNQRDINNFSGQFTASGSSAVASEANTARATVARTATGKYTVTFPIFYKDIYGYGASLKVATPAGVSIQVDSITKNSSGKCVMVIGTYAVTSFAAADATGVICWFADVRR